MAWSYSGDPSRSDLDEVRFLIGDTNEDDPQLQDEEVEYLLAEHGSPQQAAIAACEALYALYSRYADQKTGDISISYSKRADQVRALATTIQQRTSLNVAPYAGGISRADREVDEGDSDRVVPAFDVGSMDYDGPRSSTEED
jgi:hypothetical protein